MNTSSGQTAIVRANSSFMLAHPAYLLAQGFGSGLAHTMPGTFGTLFGWLSFNVLSSRWSGLFTPENWLLIVAAGFLIGIPACARTGRDLGVADHGSMVWDEIVAIWLVMLFVSPAGAWTQFCAFLIFRFFDMVKPQPIRHFDRTVKGGFGVMLDDLIAAFMTLLVFAIWRAL